MMRTGLPAPRLPGREISVTNESSPEDLSSDTPEKSSENA